MQGACPWAGNFSRHQSLHLFKERPGFIVLWRANETWDVKHQAEPSTWHLSNQWIQWIFTEHLLCRLWSSHGVSATKRRRNIPLLPSPFIYHHPDSSGFWKPVNVKPSGYRTVTPDVLIFNISFWCASRIAFLGEILLAALSPEHSGTKPLWLLGRVRPFTPGLQGLGRNRTLET